MKKYISIIAVFFTIGISGCKKDFLSLEVNPNQPSVTTPQLTLSGALATAAAIINTTNPQDGVWVGYWTPSGNYVPSSTIQQFQISNTSFTGVWTALYGNLTNFNNLQVASAKDPAAGNFQAIAMIMKAYDFQQLVDQFGDVPYSQAFQPSTILFPAYDKAQAIYDDLTKQLTAAIALINKTTTGTNPGSSDIVFAGDMTKWKRFANSLLLRFAIRQSNLPTNAAKDALPATAKEGYLNEDVQASANPGYSNDAGKQSPFYGAYGFDANNNPGFNNVFYRGNRFFINLLNSFNDPRLARVYAPTSGGGIIDGNVFGDAVTTKSNPATSAVGPGLLISPTQRAVLFSANESLFLQAEALVRGYDILGATPGPKTPKTAQEAYERGITASFVALGATSVDNSTTPPTTRTPEATAAIYYGQAINNVGWAASSDKIKAIIYQKYISMIGYNVLEPYLEYERTGYPVLPNPVSIDPAAISPTIPKRQFYPASEVNSNSVQLAKEGTINIFTSKIFWEK